MLRQRSLSTLHALLAAVALAGCGPGAGGGNCAHDGGPACPATPPSYAGEVSAIVQTRCVGCHTTGGLASLRPFTSHADIQRQSDAMFNQLLNCRMPPVDAPQPTEDERNALLAWLACGAPNN